MVPVEERSARGYGAPERCEPDDPVVARRLTLGDPSALADIVARHWEALTAFATRILVDRGLAEDAAQGAFIRLWVDRASPPRSIRAYLFTVTRNLALDQIRSRASRAERELHAVRADARVEATPAEVFDGEVLAGEVHGAIERLPPRRREAFVLAYLEQLSYAQAAERMGVSEKTVGHHVSAALSELRQRLEPVLAERFPSLAAASAAEGEWSAEASVRSTAPSTARGGSRR